LQKFFSAALISTAAYFKDTILYTKIDFFGQKLQKNSRHGAQRRADPF